MSTMPEAPTLPTAPTRRWWPWAVAGVLVLALIAGSAILVSGLVAARSFVAHRSARPALTPADSGLAYSVIPLRARDGTDLEGWWIPPRDGARRRDLAVVVLAHGEDELGKASMLRHAGYLHRAGFILLLIDFRSYGGSKGDERTGGFLEQQDIAAAVRLAHERAVGAPVCVLGEGTGSLASFLAVAQDPSIVALVSDSSPVSLEAELGRAAARGSFAPALVPVVALGVERIVGRGLVVEEVSALRAAPLAANRPIMVIAGAKDDRVPLSDTRALLRAIGPANATWSWVEPNTGHTEVFDQHPSEYAERVAQFLDAACSKPRR